MNDSVDSTEELVSAETVEDPVSISIDSPSLTNFLLIGVLFFLILIFTLRGRK